MLQNYYLNLGRYLRFYTQFHLNLYFDIQITASDTKLHKPFPDPIQKAIDEAAREATVYERTVAVDSEAKAIEELKAKGVKFTVCPDGTFAL